MMIPEDMTIIQLKKALEEQGNYLCMEHNNNFGEGVCTRAIEIIAELEELVYQKDKRIKELENANTLMYEKLSKECEDNQKAYKQIKELQDFIKLEIEHNKEFMPLATDEAEKGNMESFIYRAEHILKG